MYCLKPQARCAGLLNTVYLDPTKETVTVGRNYETFKVLNKDIKHIVSVSRNHLSFTYRDNAWYVKRLGAKNKATPYINNSPLFDEVKLNIFDQVDFFCFYSISTSYNNFLFLMNRFHCLA